MDHQREGAQPTESDQAINTLDLEELAKLGQSIDEVGSGGSGDARASVSLETILDKITHQSTQLAGVLSSLQERTDANQIAHDAKAPSTLKSVTGSDGTPCDTQGTCGAVNSDLALELQAMKARIAQLEKDAENRATQQSAAPATHCCSPKSWSKLNTKVKLLENMQLEIGKRLDQVTQSVSRLELDKIVHEDRVRNMTSTVDGLVQLRHSLNTMHGKVAKRTELSESMVRLEDKMAAINLQLAELKENQQEIKQAQTTKEALSQSHSADKVMPSFLATFFPNQTTKPNQKIAFDRLTSNVGDCYDVTTSEFMAPVKGTYLFSVSVNSNSNGLLTLAFMHNGTEVAYCSECNKDAQQANTIILPLEARDCVWVKAESQTSCTGVELGYGFSNFTGCRLH